MKQACAVRCLSLFVYSLLALPCSWASSAEFQKGKYLDQVAWQGGISSLIADGKKIHLNIENSVQVEPVLGIAVEEMKSRVFGGFSDEVIASSHQSQFDFSDLRISTDPEELYLTIKILDVSLGDRKKQMMFGVYASKPFAQTKGCLSFGASEQPLFSFEHREKAKISLTDSKASLGYFDPQYLQNVFYASGRKIAQELLHQLEGLR